MSVVVAIRDEGKVYLGADSQVTKGGTRRTLKNPNNYKIWKVNGVDHCLMAHVGNVRDANVIRIISDLVDEFTLLRNKVNFEYVVRDIVPHIIDELRRYGYVNKRDDAEFTNMNSEFLFAFRDKLFLINSDATVIEIDDCVAIGSGACEAIGSILTSDKENPRDRITKAIKASAANDIYVDYPIILCDTKAMEFSVITEKSELNTPKGDK